MGRFGAISPKPSLAVGNTNLGIYSIDIFIYNDASLSLDPSKSLPRRLRCKPSPWMVELANVAGYMSRAEQSDRKLLQESKGMVISKVSKSSTGKKHVYQGWNLVSIFFM